MPAIAVIGATTWGATLGVLWAQRNHDVRLLARSEHEAQEMAANRLYDLPLPSGKFPPRLAFTGSAGKAIEGARAVVLVVPSQSLRSNIKQIAAHIRRSMLVVSASKGIEVESGKRMSQVIAEELPESCHRNICVLSGPNLAREIIEGHPAATVIANEDLEVARAAQRLLNTPQLCVYTNTDVVGVELGGALKNIVALAAGVADGLGYGDNAKAALMTRGLAEITALGVALGANPLTLAGLAGFGDLMATCASPLSRNHHVGIELAKGRKLEDITDEMDNVAEGVGTTQAAWKLAQKLGIGMPITEKMYRVLYEGLSPKQAAEELLKAETHHELYGRRWRLLDLVRRRRKATPPPHTSS